MDHSRKAGRIGDRALTCDQPAIAPGRPGGADSSKHPTPAGARSSSAGGQGISDQAGLARVGIGAAVDPACGRSAPTRDGVNGSAHNRATCAVGGA
jgi:hypothetical protein